MNPNRIILIVLAAAAVFLGAVFAIAAATAAPPFSATFGTTGVAKPAGTEIPLGSVNVPAELQHRDCIVHVHMQNNESVHIGSALRVTTDGSVWQIPDVEAVANHGQDYTSTMTLGSTITFAGVTGVDPDPKERDGFSGSGTVTVDCPDTAPTTTQPPVVTTQPPVQPSSVASIAKTPAEIGHGPEHTG